MSTDPGARRRPGAAAHVAPLMHLLASHFPLHTAGILDGQDPASELPLL